MSYYEWVQTFKLLRNSPMDENIIKKLEHQKVNYNEYVMNRLLIHVIKMIQIRLHNSGLKCIKQLTESKLDVNVLTINLIDLKKEKQYILKITELQIFDDNNRKKLVDFINKKFEEIINTLKTMIEEIDIEGSHINAFEQIIYSK